MNMSHIWKSTSRKKKTKPTYKIHWEALGLSRPDRTTTSLSIEAIRSEVSVMAAQGLSERTPTPTDELPSRKARHQKGSRVAVVDRKKR